MTRLLRADTEAGTHQLAVVPGVLDPAVGIGGEVGVLAEDLLRSYELLQLHQEAVLAHVRVQRVEGLHLVELRGA